MRLWLYLTLLVNAVVLVAFTGLGAYTAQERARVMEGEFRSDTQRLAESLAKSISGLLLTRSFDLIEEALLGQISLGDMRQLMVAGADGRMIAHVFRDAKGQGRSVYLQQRMPFELHQRTQIRDDALTVVVPVVAGVGIDSSEQGWLLVQVNLQRIKEARSAIVRSAMWATLFAMGFVTLILLWLIGPISKSLQRTAKLARDLESGTTAGSPERSRISEIQQINAALMRTGEALSAQFMELHASETRKAAILESSLDAMVTMDSLGTIVDWNRAAEDTLGWTRDEAVGQDLAGLIIPPVHRQSHVAGMARYLATGVGPVLGKRIEITAMRRTGEEFAIDLAIVPFEIQGDKYFLGAIRDISARKKLEAEREQMNTRLKQVADELAVKQLALDEHAIVSITDGHGIIVYVNDLFVAISQYSREELLGQNHRILKSTQHSSSFYDHMWTTISAGEVWHGDICNRAKNGQDYWVASTIVPVVDAQGLPVQYISIRTDITPLKRVEQQLEMSAKSLGKLVDSFRQAQQEVQAAQKRELDIGHQIQKSMLFGSMPPVVGHVSLLAFTEPSLGVDGDFFEFVPYGQEHFDVIIGDVMGKGVSAALIGAGVKQRINQVCAEQIAEYCLKRRTTPTPASIMNGLHERVAQQLADLSSFVTLAYLRFDLASNRVAFVDAGHSQFMLVNRESVKHVLGRNLPLGVMADEVYEADELQVNAGDLIFLYSDGFTEARNVQDEEFGIERLEAAILHMYRAQLPNALLVQSLRTTVQLFEDKISPSDDRTCIVLRVGPPDAASQHPARLDFSVPWDIQSLSILRTRLQQAVLARGMGAEESDALILAAYEAATNLIRHASAPVFEPSVHVRIEDVGDEIEVSFFYLGEPFQDFETTPDFSGHSEGGFGLFIIRSSVDEARYDSPALGVARVYLKKKKGKPEDLPTKKAAS